MDNQWVEQYNATSHSIVRSGCGKNSWRRVRCGWLTLLICGGVSPPAIASIGPDWQQVEGGWQQAQQQQAPDSDKGVTLQANTLLTPAILVRGGWHRQRYADLFADRLEHTSYSLQLGARTALNQQTDLYVFAGPLFWHRRWSADDMSLSQQHTGFTGQAGVRMAVHPMLEVTGAVQHDNIHSYSDTFPQVQIRYRLLPDVGVFAGGAFRSPGNHYQLGVSWHF